MEFIVYTEGTRHYIHRLERDSRGRSQGFYMHHSEYARRQDAIDTCRILNASVGVQDAEVHDD
jgi:hypothetical protein